MFYVTTALCYYFSFLTFYFTFYYIFCFILFSANWTYCILFIFGVAFFTSHKCNLIVNISFISNVLPFFMYSFISHLSFYIVLTLVLHLLSFCCVFFCILVFNSLFHVDFFYFPSLSMFHPILFPISAALSHSVFGIPFFLCPKIIFCDILSLFLSMIL